VVELLSREERVGTGFGRPRQLEDALGADPAIAGGLELIRTGGAARLPTLDAAQVIEVELDLGTAAAARPHMALLVELIPTEQGLFQTWNGEGK